MSSARFESRIYLEVDIMHDHRMNPEVFKGRFTPHLREAFRNKRLSLGLSLQQLGEFLKLDWSTIRKWESGQTCGCHPRHIIPVQKFLDGEFDRALSTSSRELEELASCWHKLPAMMHNCLERITMIYELCESDPDLRSMLMEQLNSTAHNAVMELAGFGGDRKMDDIFTGASV